MMEEFQMIPNDDKSAKLSQFESLPIELKMKIFGYASFEDKKQLRTACTMFLKCIDPELTFHVKLSDETAKWVNYGDIHYVDTIEVEGLAMAFDLKKLPRIGRLIIGANNTEENIWNIIKHCTLDKDLEHLEFTNNSIGDLSQLNEESENYMILHWVKSLTLKVIGKSRSELLSLEDALLIYRTVYFFKYIRLPLMESLSVQIEFNLLGTDTSANLIIVELYKFLNIHALPLANLTAQLKLCSSNPPQELNTILTALELESLTIASSNSNDVIPLIQVSRNLKNFKITDQSLDSLRTHNRPTDYGSAVLDLLENCKSLEVLVLEVSGLDSTMQLQVQKCVSLKLLEIRCIVLHVRTVNESFNMPNLTHLHFEVGNKEDRHSAEIIQSWLNASHGLEELTMTFVERLDSKATTAILAMPGIQKVILKDTGGLPRSVEQFCKSILSVPCIMVEKCKCAHGQWEWERGQENTYKGLSCQGNKDWEWIMFQGKGLKGWMLQKKSFKAWDFGSFEIRRHCCADSQRRSVQPHDLGFQGNDQVEQELEHELVLELLGQGFQGLGIQHHGLPVDDPGSDDDMW